LLESVAYQQLAIFQELAVSTQQSVVFRWRMARTDLAPGWYRIKMLPQMTDEAGRLIRPQASIVDFEARNPSTPQEAADVILRKGWRAFLAGRYDDADRVAEDVLRVNQRSYAAFVLKGQIASERRKPAEKLEMYRTALALASAKLDPWCTQCSNDLNTPTLIEGLRCLVSGFVCE
jgi:hypothetical protein